MKQLKHDMKDLFTWKITSMSRQLCTVSCIKEKLTTSQYKSILNFLVSPDMFKSFLENEKMSGIWQECLLKHYVQKILMYKIYIGVCKN